LPNEIPQPNPPLSAAEKSAVGKLTEADLEKIDDTILSFANPNWRKVALVIIKTEDALTNRYPDLSYIFYAQRLIHLARQGMLESQGNLLFMRFSEVRLPQSKPKMTRALAESRSVGDPNGPKFDGTAFLALLKK
jgi:hypothetical protein